MKTPACKVAAKPIYESEAAHAIRTSQKLREF
jgi:hypothetical protein